MMGRATKVISGTAISAKIRQQIKDNIDSVVALTQTTERPALGMIMVGDRQDSRLYVEAKGRACAEVGIRAENRFFAQSTTQAEILRQVHAFNADPTIDGILIQMPLPATIDEKAVVDAVLPTKDVDGLHPYNVGELAMRRRTPYFTACTPEGIVEMLDQEAVPIAGRVAVVLGRSDLVGNPVGMLLRKRHATVISCHSQTTQIENLVRQADIVVSACGVPQFVRGEWLKPGCVVIDVGINFVGNDMVGDVCFNEALGIASAITPVPGGVGPMTIAMLMRNVCKSFHRRVTTGDVTAE
ncbi:hypothetical protein H257_07865 [Aphanomyces astaci]|uniref:Uncharacterized protein n=1 Tax=Aphanomyces astaci TaxID=112090 RepID=W4GJF8_APHAT|nr:hypothetical protein H257_07865 [Aphanomyces astaci]ETV79134.1 hypothetical protein H257_07865 [Aphanomyces astaci]|eukprot:XP_009831853.1 hypothetical protein H257_07865 [Aphanomyces astaci]